MKNFTKILSILFAAVIILSGCSSNKAADSQDRSADEKLALSYVTDYYNGTKKADREKFVDENIHPDLQGKSRVWAKSGASEDQKLKDPKVAESIPYDDGETKGSLVLIQSADDKEMIVLTTENKVYMHFSLQNTAPDTYKEIRDGFKTAK
ncbi:hypothetical protein [Paenibacillus sp.]|jgi:hypothetical protein|uniref:hypothetical protein n=1 Tax=Paenibacillus sp. TaxID=58172 RepID=UPI002816F834|nr:hypothetical protein [Paenibacillus sp.]MDR0268065.1 hypothetical protein [Paenibacillus sp.]